MGQRDIWWERWGLKYKPVSWKAWASFGVFCCLIPAIIFGGEAVSGFFGFANRRLIPAIGVIIFLISSFWFVEQHTPPREHRARPKSGRRHK
jgi:hypothetical protein